MTQTLTQNAEQKEAIQHLEGPCLVIAGAGSGKTFVVTKRICNLIHEGVLPRQILALTFTNKAAGEMKKRVLNESSEFVLTLTFHSLGARLLREFIDCIGYSKDFTIYDQSDSLKLISSCMQELGLKADKGSQKKSKSWISKCKNDFLLPQEAKEKGLVDIELGFEIYSLYQKRLKEFQALDFDDLLFMTLKVLQNDEISKTVQERWPFVLIDEYQDTNHSQYLIIQKLVGERQNLFAVGDPDQSIYSWRGACVSNILDFDKDFKGAKVITLKKNYRSTNAILKAANRLIANNTERHDKELYSDLEEGNPVEVQHYYRESQEKDLVLRQIEHFNTHSNTPFKEMAILYRTNAQSRSFEDALLFEDIPYAVVGALSFYQRREIKDLLSLLVLFVSRHDFVSFSRVVNLPKRGIGAKSLQKLYDVCKNEGVSIIDLCKEIYESKRKGVIPAKATAGVKEFMMAFKNCTEDYNYSKSLPDLLDSCLKHFRYMQVLDEEKESKEDRLENIDELRSKLHEFSAKHKGASLKLFLQEVSLFSSSHDDESDDRVTLMTLHHAKGLEFDLCFMVGLEEDVFPHINCKDDPRQLEEERRLCYVGMTRAKKQLFMTSVRSRFVFGSYKNMQKSRFLEEIESDEPLLNEPEMNESCQDTNTRSNSVRHPLFGVGKIIKTYETTHGTTYDIIFSSDGVKRTLAAKYAKLIFLA